MRHKLLISVLFSTKNIIGQKLQNFRKRFDMRYDEMPDLHMPLFAPIELRKSQVPELIEMLRDEVESFFHLSSPLILPFFQLDVELTHKNQILFLRPSLNSTSVSDLFYLQESLIDLCRQFADTKVKPLEKRFAAQKQYMPLARIPKFHDFTPAIETFKDHFTFPVELKVNQLVVFEKSDQQLISRWSLRDELFSFLCEEERFLKDVV